MLAKAENYISDRATIIGDVRLGNNVSIWPGVVLRADGQPIIIGDNSNIQDNAVLHADTRSGIVIGKGVSVGHGAIVHGATIGDNCLIGMGAIVMSEAVVEHDVIIGSGALVAENKTVIARSLMAGIPAKKLRELVDQDIKEIQNNASEYIELKNKYLNQ